MPRAVLVALVGLAVLAVASTAVVLGFWDPPHLPSDFFSSGTAVLAAGCCLASAGANRGLMRVAWLLFAAMMASYAAGDVLWLAYGGSEGNPPILGLADAMYIVGFVLGTLGLLAYPIVQGLAGMWRPLLLDASVLVASLVFLLYTLVVHEIVESAANALEAFMLILYPVTNMLVAALVLLLMLRTVGHLRLDVVLVGFAFAGYTLADSGYGLMMVAGQDSTGTWVDAAYTVAPLVLSAAALLASTTPTPRRTLRRHLTGVVTTLLPDLSALLALAVAAAVHTHDVVSAVLGIVTLTAVGIRQVAQTQAGEELRGQLERRVDERTEELAELTEAYRRLDAMKYEFVTAVSHELRTPLTAIRGSLEMLRDGDAGDLPPMARSVVSIAARGSERLSRLVNDIIDLERLESGAFGFVPAVHPVECLVDDAVTSLRSLAEDQGVQIAVETAEGKVWCDSDRIVQVLVNLLGNALKFSPTDTTVTVAARVVGAEVHVSVSDEGRGIPADELESVFDRFHQVEIDDSRQLGGAGLGLTICQRIVERHGGRIWVESPGRGATFHFTLPAPSREVTGQGETADAREPANGRAAKGLARSAGVSSRLRLRT